MKKFEARALKGLAYSASALAMVVAAPAFAQDAEVDCDNLDADLPIPAECQETIVGADGQVDGEAGIVVTGSRIQRNSTYNSISPLQILETQSLQDTGQFDAAAILQQSESAAGQQIDATFQGFVLNNGPGSQTLDLRGLGADRTLLLVNGRRLAPAGVEGAPTNPSINLIPSSLVARYDLLLDGASSVYGSDAVAGVGNIVLRRDIDGVELFASGNYNEQGGGDDWQVSGAWGKTGSNFNFGIGAEFARRDEVKYRDRAFLAGCNTPYEIDQDGNVLTTDLRSDANTRRLSNGAIREPLYGCTIDAATARIIPQGGLFFSSIYYDERTFASTGQAGNSFIPNFTDSLDAFGRPVDRNGDGLLDVDFGQVTRNGTDLDPSLISGQDLYNVMAYGEYTFDGDMAITPFFEANYSRAESSARGRQGQLFPIIPAANPFNPCNISSFNGTRINPSAVDCGLAQNQFDGLTGTVNARPLGLSRAVQVVVGVEGDRSTVETVQEQYRGVFGLKGNLPFIDFGAGDDWTFELSGSYSRSEGKSSRLGIREDRLAFALGIDPSVAGLTRVANPVTLQATPGVAAGTPCNLAGIRTPGSVSSSVTDGCVPVNLFAPSLYRTAVGDFATQAERDYLFDSRDFDTTYEQTVISAFVQGSLFELAGGTAKGVIGVEYRDDTLNSMPDDIAANGLFWGFFSDSGGFGSKDIYEAFAEVDLPLMSGKTLVEDLRLNLSGRITEDEFYGTNETYSIKFGWRPFEQLLIKASYGTSFRSPNLRELFLAGQSGFATIFDPCAVPTAAYAPLAGGYNASLDNRDALVLANCIREGRDPTVVGTDGATTAQNASVEVTSGGSLALDPETSTSFTTGFAFAENLGPIDFSFNFNYYKINLKGAIAEPTGGFIVNQCFTRDDGVRSNFCDFVEYAPDGRQLISDVFAGFVNINSEKVEGIDLNADFRTDVAAFGKDVRLGLNLRANHLITRDTVFLDDQGVPSITEQAGEFGFPYWTGRATFTAAVDNVTFSWQTRMIGRTEQDPEGIDPLADAFGYGPDGLPVLPNAAGNPTQFGDTCLGNGARFTSGPNRGQVIPQGQPGFVAGDGVFCRDVGFANAYFISTASVRVDFDKFDIRLGVTNLFDRNPPRIDTSEVFGINNIPIGNGYDLNGREFFGTVSVKF
ncbi:TonB-dependent receptor domain-containing protein [Parerythrobacter lacustris]|uniref:TonB-dependent receptor n=1 Tax=Parerythrobacter lacustris TaxID=2969984 RepID=A0ABT1XT86_9SPHN|nr:TonB-dependent receptor [Parerythrobacter lacustris]MCR2834848.1 TonB-dependent receptor [Parerythrobacter lacustris]